MPGLKLHRSRRFHEGAERETEYEAEAPVFADTEEAATGKQVFGPASRRAITAGVANSDFGDPPEDLTQVIDDTNNPLPDWSFVRSSGTSVDAQVVADSGSASGYVLRFSMRDGAAGDEAYIEQVVPINSSRAQNWGYFGLMGIVTPASVTAATIALRLQYLKADGTTVGSEFSVPETLSTIGASQIENVLTNTGMTVAQATATSARLRIVLNRAAAAASATQTLDITDLYVLPVPDPQVFRDAVYLGPAQTLRLFRAGDGILQIDSDGTASQSRLLIEATAGQQAMLDLQVDGDSAPRVRIHGDADFGQTIELGPGNAAVDWRLERTAANVVTLASGDSLEGDQWTPGYAEVTSSQGSITTLVDLTSLSVAFTVISGHRIRITGMALFRSTVGTDQVALFIREGSTTLATAAQGFPGANTDETAVVFAILQPTAGAHTYKLSAQRNNGTGTLTMTASATAPALIFIEDCGV